MTNHAAHLIRAVESSLASQTYWWSATSCSTNTWGEERISPGLRANTANGAAERVSGGAAVIAMNLAGPHQSHADGVGGGDEISMRWRRCLPRRE
jgi:hypothetical protein